jgi:hypothetical protein
MNKKFAELWKNQTELGKRFGLSSIGVGKILSEHWLKDGKSATRMRWTNDMPPSSPWRMALRSISGTWRKLLASSELVHKPLSDVADYNGTTSERLLAKFKRLRTVYDNARREAEEEKEEKEEKEARRKHFENSQ